MISDPFRSGSAGSLPSLRGIQDHGFFNSDSDAVSRGPLCYGARVLIAKDPSLTTPHLLLSKGGRPNPFAGPPFEPLGWKLGVRAFSSPSLIYLRASWDSKPNRPVIGRRRSATVRLP